MILLPWLILLAANDLTQLNCYAIAALFLILSSALSLSFFESSWLARKGLIIAFLKNQSRLAAWLSRPYWLILSSSLKGAFFALVLMFEASQWSRWIWSLLLFDAILIGLIWHGIQRRFKSSIKPLFRASIARRLTLWINTVLCGAWLTAGYFYFPMPDYRPYGLMELIQSQSEQIQAQCDWIEPILRWQTIKQIGLNYTLQTQLDKVSFWLKLAIWLPFFILSSFFIWIYTRWVLVFTLNRQDARLLD